MCLSQMHAGERQCIVNTFFLSAFSLEHICSSHSSFFFQIHIQVFFSLPPFRLSRLSTRYLRGSWSMLIIKSTKDFCTTTQLGISKASITLGKKTKQLLQCLIWSQPLLPQTPSQFLKLLSKLQKIPLRGGRAGEGCCWEWSM